jgi:hypothetical protein
MTEFFVTLKNEKRKSYKRIAAFLFATNLLLLIYVWLQTATSGSKMGSLIVCVAFAIGGLALLFFKQEKSYSNHLFLLSYFTAVYTWFLFEYVWISLLLIVLLMLYYIAIRSFKIIVNANTITYPKWPVQKIEWKELNNVVLKDGLFTLDFKSDKILQQHIEETNVENEPDFNDFCRQQLNK